MQCKLYVYICCKPTEIGVRIRLLNEETKKYCVKWEQQILKKFEDIRSESTLELRNLLHEVW